ncbi:hypothetical protein ACOSQ4_021372 [Xanthoceras sorbifolium]
MANSGVDGRIPHDEERGVDAIWSAIASTRQQLSDIHDMLTHRTLNADQQPVINRNRTKGVALDEPIDIPVRNEFHERELTLDNHDVYNGEDDTKRQTIAPANKEFSKNPNPYARAAPLKCYRCGKSGHKSNDCPSRKYVNLAK